MFIKKIKVNKLDIYYENQNKIDEQLIQLKNYLTFNSKKKFNNNIYI